MKTIVMDAKNILNAEWLDILFDGRNKMYGAYHLRKHYHKKLITALTITFLSMVLLFLVLRFRGQGIAHDAIFPAIPDTEWATIPLQNIVLPPPPKAAITSTLLSSTRQRYAKPVIINNNDTEAERVVSLSEDAAISTSTQLAPAQHQVQAPLELPPLTPVGSAAASSSEPGQVATTVDQSAMFPGGLSAWKRYLERNLDATSTRAPAGVYVVVVKFIVGKDGKIRDVFAETLNGYGMEEEAVKVIRKGPRWIPALLNTEQVEAWHRQSITFVISGD